MRQRIRFFVPDNNEVLFRFCWETGTLSGTKIQA